MIEILPDKLIKHIEAKCGNIATTPDFFDVIGQVRTNSPLSHLIPVTYLEDPVHSWT